MLLLLRLMQYPIKEIKLNSKEYPKTLKQITGPPKQLYCRGNLNLLNTFCFGVVGTRKLTNYGKEATTAIINGLSGNDITIVSGLALGIDAIAHQTALDNGLPTIAVLGAGIDDETIYPGENFKLAKNILKNEGLIISEYPTKTSGFKSNFPARNRIISGLSKGVLIIEAPEKSGALITARYATEQNRDIFALPGNIFSINSQGPNMLIRKGAKPVFSAEDIIGAYYQNLQFDLKPKKNISTKDPVEKKILDILNEMGELSSDEIIRATELEVSPILSAISMLEIKNKIKNLGNGKYRKI